MDPGSDEDHLAASTRLKVLWRGDGEEVKTMLLLEERKGESERERVREREVKIEGSHDRFTHTN